VAPGSDGSSRPGTSGPVKQHGGLPPAPAGSLAAAAAAPGSNGSLRSLGQQVAATHAGQAGKGASNGALLGAEGSPLTKGVKAHAVMLSQTALVNM